MKQQKNMHLLRDSFHLWWYLGHCFHSLCSMHVMLLAFLSLGVHLLSDHTFYLIVTAKGNIISFEVIVTLIWLTFSIPRCIYGEPLHCCWLDCWITWMIFPFTPCDCMWFLLITYNKLVTILLCIACVIPPLLLFQVGHHWLFEQNMKEMLVMKRC